MKRFCPRGRRRSIRPLRSRSGIWPARRFSGTQDAEKRLVNHLKKRQAIETQQIARARELVLPLGKPQERVLTLAPWLARYGPSCSIDLLDVDRELVPRGA